MTVPQWNRFPELVHAFSTRRGGVSEPPYDSLNINLLRPSSQQGVMENFKRITQALNVGIDDLTLINYAHGDNIEIVRRRHRGMGLLRKTELPVCDALITNESGIVIVTTHADCSSFMIYDPTKQVVAACHAGWKGILLRIGQKTIGKMYAAFGSKPEDCLTGIGPCICADCFEVDFPVAELFETEYPGISIKQKRKDGKYLVDLVQCAAKQFIDAGIRPEKMVIADECTYELKDRYYSFRRDGAVSGSMAGFIGLR